MAGAEMEAIFDGIAAEDWSRIAAEDWRRIAGMDCGGLQERIAGKPEGSRERSWERSQRGSRNRRRDREEECGEDFRDRADFLLPRRKEARGLVIASY